MIRKAYSMKTVLFSTLALTGSLSSHAIAEESEQAEDKEVSEEILVTASRRSESLQDTALAVSVLNPVDLAKSGITELKEAIKFVPGISLFDTGRSTNNNVFIRGIDATVTAGVATYLDEIPLGGQGRANASTPLDGSFLDLDQLTVLRGPQGTLWGGSAMGGLIQYNTKTPSLNEWSGSVSTDLSSTSRGGFNQTYRVAASGGLIEDTLGFAFTAFRKEQEGFVDNLGLGVSDWDNYEFSGASAKLLWQPSEDLSVTLQGLIQTNKQGTGAVADLEVNANGDITPPSTGAYTTAGGLPSPVDLENEVVGLTVKYDLGWAELTSVTAYQSRVFNQTSDFNTFFGPFLDTVLFPEDAPHSDVFLIRDTPFERTTQELRLTSEANGELEWIVGIFYSDEEGFSDELVTSDPFHPTLFDALRGRLQNELAGFANITYYFTPDFDMTFGVRQTHYEDTLENTGYSFLQPVNEFAQTSNNVTTYLLNARYRVDDDLSLYARAASGYRPGGSNVVLQDAQGNPVGEPFFLPDELWNYEVGAKGSFADGRGNYEATFFYIDWEDYLISVVLNGLSLTANADQASSKGFEGSFGYSLSDNLSLNASMAYIDAQLETDEPGIGGGAGQQLPNSPKWSGNLSLKYDFEIGSYPAYASATYRYKGKTPSGFDGVMVDGTFVRSQSANVVSDSYGVINLNAGISTGSFDVSLYANNLFNEYGHDLLTGTYADLFDTTNTAIGTAAGAVIRPRTVGVTAKWNFN